MLHARRAALRHRGVRPQWESEGVLEEPAAWQQVRYTLRFKIFYHPSFQNRGHNRTNFLIFLIFPRQTRHQIDRR